MSLETPEGIRRLQRGLYTKAKGEPAFRFYLLYDKVYREDILAHAYAVARRKGGTAGVDGVSFEEIETEGRGEWLASLGKELREKTYKASAVRRVMISKPGGGERPLGIPTIKDRVVQTAAKMVLEPIFEADFEDSAYGYRPGRSALGAIAEVERALRSGETDVVDADLSRYFDTIPHDQLMQSVARRVSDGQMLALVKSWLKVPVEETDEHGGKRLTGGQKSQQGTPQGGVISPLLANIYINRMLRVFVAKGKGREFRGRLVNYADDFVILTRGRGKAALEWARRVLGVMGLSLNETKTTVRDARNETFDFLGYTFGPIRSGRTGRSHLWCCPSEKAVQRVKGKLRALLRRGDDRPWDVVRQRVNRTLQGWRHYFGYGWCQPAHWKLDKYVTTRVRIFLRHRHKVSSRGTRQFSRAAIFKTYGIRCLAPSPVAVHS